MEKNFQYIVIGAFIFFAVFGVGAFALFGKFGGSDEEGPKAQISIWGMQNERIFAEFIDKIDTRAPNLIKVKYSQKDPDTFDQDLIEALASGVGPDLVILPQDRLIRHKDKIYPIPYETLDERTFKDSFIEVGEVFMEPSGIYAIPFSIDPLVMYWNRDIFRNNSLSLPPAYWDEFFSKMIPLSMIDTSRNIKQSATAMGEYDNINNAKEIFSALLLQTGNPIISDAEGRSQSTLSSHQVGGINTTKSVLRFYTEFSNPSKEVYSWNKSLPLDKNEFLAGDLATYFGFASEALLIQEKNPNLNFDVALLPQVRDSKIRATFANVSGVAILKNSKYIADAYSVASILTSKESALDYSSVSFLPPLRRALLSDKPENAISAVFYESAIIARSYLDPDRIKTDLVFEKMIENITSGKLNLDDSVEKASMELNSLLIQ